MDEKSEERKLSVVIPMLGRKLSQCQEGVSRTHLVKLLMHHEGLMDSSSYILQEIQLF